MENVSTTPNIARLLRSLALHSILGCALVCSVTANAQLLIESSRIVYPQGRRDVPIRIKNPSPEKPALVQLWIDEAETDAGPENSDAPFILSPPLVRLAANGGQTVRIMYTGEPQNPERESLYTLNLLELSLIHI